MASKRTFQTALVGAAALMLVPLIGAQQRTADTQAGGHGPATFKPMVTFAGTTLAGRHPLGSATWKAAAGEYMDTAQAGGAGGWLVLDKSYQEVQLHTSFKCSDPCSAGMLVRAARTADGGLRGAFVSLAPSDLGAHTLTLDANGKELARERLAAAARGQGAPPPPGGRGDASGAAGAAGNLAPVGGLYPTIISPPWSTLTAYDLNTGKIVWQVPYGDAASRAGPARNSELRGNIFPKSGPVITARGLILFSAMGACCASSTRVAAKRSELLSICRVGHKACRPCTRPTDASSSC